MNTPSAIVQEMSEKMEKPKLCKDCKYSKKGFLLPVRMSQCIERFSINAVSGEKEYSFCSIQRMNFPQACGEEGKYWEAK